tara:strand:+ start:31395 stop:31664 length:270 start_codon:yes stop_codon:yes gene_type:complete
MNDDIKNAVDYIARSIRNNEIIAVKELYVTPSTSSGESIGNVLREESVTDICKHVMDYANQPNSAISNRYEFADVVERAVAVRDYNRRY